MVLAFALVDVGLLAAVDALASSFTVLETGFASTFAALEAGADFDVLLVVVSVAFVVDLDVVLFEAVVLASDLTVVFAVLVLAVSVLAAVDFVAGFAVVLAEADDLAVDFDLVSFSAIKTPLKFICSLLFILFIKQNLRANYTICSSVCQTNKLYGNIC